MPRIGRYEILGELGRGAMGAVYKARDPTIGRIVAIKIILTAGLAAEELAQYKQRFYREAQTAGQVSHPGIVTIHDVAEDESGQPYLVMEYVEGITLHRMLRPAHTGHLPERLPLDRALDLAAQVAEALDFAHRRGIVHRDVKPGNIIITPEGRAKIADFGIAKFTDAEATRTTTVLGTPAYMAPEQVRGGAVDGRSDLFSLGAMLYWMVTGEKPFSGDDLTAVSFKVVYTDPTPPRQLVPELPADLETVLSRCLAKNPAHRYAVAKELAADLQALRAGRPVTATAVARARNAEETVTGFPAAAVPVAVPVVRADAAPAEAKKPPRPVPRELRPTIAAAGLLALVALAIYTLWPWLAGPVLAPGDASQQQPAATTPTGQPGPASGEGSGRAAAPSAAPVPVRVAMSSLEVDCRHSFRSATLTIHHGSRKLVSAEMAGKSGLFGRVSGKWQDTAAIPAGTRKLRVRVVSTDEKNPFDQEAQIEGAFEEGRPRRLLIEFPKRQIKLRWAEKEK